MTTPQTYLRVTELLRGAKRILCITDERIDGDTIGSTLGLAHTLKKLGKEVVIFSPKPMTPSLAHLPGAELILRDLEELKLHLPVDVAIVCDAAEGDFLPPIQKLLSAAPLISFDHHATNPRYATINIVESQSASTADVVWRYLQSTDWEIPREAAQCLLTGICTDTELFSTANTTTAAIQASAELIRLGGNLKEIIRHHFMNRSLASLRLWGRALERLFQDDITGGVATVITLKDFADLSVDEHDLAGITNFLNAMLTEEHDIVAVYRELPEGGLKCALRSRTADVSALARRLSPTGGGHKLAAGCKLPTGKAEQQGGVWKVRA